VEVTRAPRDREAAVAQVTRMFGEVYSDQHLMPYDSATLHIFDLQQEMLDHTARGARDAGVGNVVAQQGDARSLPYADDAFDAAYLVAVLGEIPDQDAALRELARVLRPGGRLVVGELFGDPHMVTSGALRSRAAGAGLTFAGRVGPPFGYFAVLTK